jgi:hypothetical protein
MSDGERPRARRSKPDPAAGELDGLWRVVGRLSWHTLEKPAEPEYWWFGGGRHQRLGRSLVLRPDRQQPYRITGAGRERRLHVVLLFSPEVFRFEREGRELRLFDRDRDDLPALLLQHMPGKTPREPPARPPRILDTTLGRLSQLQGLPGCYTGKVRVGPRKVSLDLLPRDAPNEALVARATRIVRALDRFVGRAARYAADQLIDVKNEAWLEDGQSPIRAIDLVRALTLLGVCIHDESVTFEFDDGGMFLGHRVKVSMGARDRLLEASI